mmetsp:Transcript_35852/g.60416  ORF Transcript_35852/g.60416 Transcript_35852/m.60416 type:complete len:470 (-) Transcript_35852:54-1463(-)
MMSVHETGSGLVPMVPTSPGLDMGDIDLETPPIVTVSVYPDAMATHQEVRADADLFLSTFQKFRVAMGGAFERIPHVAGKELDLHKLYVEVTDKGGLEKVIQDKLWKEVLTAFDCPATCTSGSFTLRKYYSKFLHDYEQVYFFRNTGAPVTAPVHSATPSTPSKQASADAEASGSGLTPPKAKKQKKNNAGKKSKAPDPLPPMLGAQITGIIESRFDYGYFVTVSHHGLEYKGMLWHQEPPASGEQPMTPTALPQATAEFLASAEPSKGKKKKREGKKDRNAPKSNKTAFNYFSVEAREKVKMQSPHLGEKDISRAVGDMWSKTPTEARLRFVAMAEEDKRRYERELKEYNEKLNELNRQHEAVAAAIAAAGQMSQIAPSTASEHNLHLGSTMQGEDAQMVDASGNYGINQVGSSAPNFPMGLGGHIHVSATAALADAIAAVPSPAQRREEEAQASTATRRNLDPIFHG